MHSQSILANTAEKREQTHRHAPRFVSGKPLKNWSCKKNLTLFREIENVKNMNVKWLFAAVLVVLFVAVGTTQVHSAKAATTRNFTLYGSNIHG